MKIKIKNKIKNILESVIFEPFSIELLEELEKRIKRILIDEACAYDDIMINLDVVPSNNYNPILSVKIFLSSGEKIVVSVEIENYS